MRTLIFLVICITLFSCKKDPHHTVVSGKVINAGSKAPMEGVLVFLEDGVRLSSTTSSDKQSQMYTGKDGYFRLELTGEHTAYLGMSKEKCTYSYVHEGAVTGIKPYPDGTYENQVFEMEAESYWSPTFLSRDLPFNSDTIIIAMLSHHLGDYDIQHGNKYGFEGSHEYYGILPIYYEHLTIGDKYQIYRTTLKRNGTVRIKVDSVYVKSFETLKDTLYY